MAFFIAIFLCTTVSFILPLFSRSWIIAMSISIVLFCFFFSIYFPIKLKKSAFAFDKENLVIYSGIFYTNISHIRLSNIQFVTKSTSILDKLFNISCVYVWTAGGRECIFGLSNIEADKMILDIADRMNNDKNAPHR